MKNKYYEGPPSDHFDGTHFFNPGLPSTDKSFRELLRWRVFGKRTRWPERVAARSGLAPEQRVAGMRITAIGHASFLLQAAGFNLLLDPVWAERASPFDWIGPRRHNPPAVASEDLPPIDAVLVTHNHYDHMDTACLGRLWKSHRPRILTPLGNDRVIQAADPEVKVTTGDWWQSFTLAEQLTVTLTPAYHWSSRRFSDRRMALWCGFVVDTPAGRIYCAGDTGYGDGAIFPEIARRCGPPDVALLPIGAYDPRWFMRSQHADPEEAVRIGLDCGAHAVLGMHWHTFQLTDEPYDEPGRRFVEGARALSQDASRFLAVQAGDVWERP